MAIASVYETPRSCIRCGVEYIPKRPAEITRIGTYSIYCSQTCQRKAGAKLGYEQQESERTQRASRPRAPLSSRRPESVKPTPIRGERVGKSLPRMSRSRPSNGFSPFARQLASLRVGRLWTRAELATAIGASENTLMNWELDRTDVSAKWLEKLAQLFGVTMDELWRGETV